MRRPAISGRRRLRDQRGAAVVSVTLGVLVFLIMLFTAVQTMYAMYLGSSVEGVSYDAARIVAQSGSSSDPSARARQPHMCSSCSPTPTEFRFRSKGRPTMSSR